MDIFNSLWESIRSIILESGLASLTWENYVMVCISFVLLFLAIKKQYEPLLLLPIAFGMLLVNVFPDIMASPTTEMLTEAQVLQRNLDPSSYTTTALNGVTYYNVTENGGLLYYLYQGVHLGIFPPLIFLGIGAMTDFGPLIANPKSFILGAAAQVGIFITFIGATLLGFAPNEAGSIATTGALFAGADSRSGVFVYGSRTHYTAAYHEAPDNKEGTLDRYEAAPSRI